MTPEPAIAHPCRMVPVPPRSRQRRQEPGEGDGATMPRGRCLARPRPIKASMWCRLARSTRHWRLGCAVQRRRQPRRRQQYDPSGPAAETPAPAIHPVAPAVRAPAAAQAPGMPETINRATYVRGINEAVDGNKVEADVSNRVAAALRRGDTVTYFVEGKPVPVTKIDRGMLADAQGQRCRRNMHLLHHVASYRNSDPPVKHRLHRLHQPYRANGGIWLQQNMSHASCVQLLNTARSIPTSRLPNTSSI